MNAVTQCLWLICVTAFVFIASNVSALFFYLFCVILVAIPYVVVDIMGKTILFEYMLGGKSTLDHLNNCMPRREFFKYQLYYLPRYYESRNNILKEYINDDNVIDIVIDYLDSMDRNGISYKRKSSDDNHNDEEEIDNAYA